MALTNSKPRLELLDQTDTNSDEKDHLFDDTDESNDDDSVDEALPQLIGNLQKWTNYLHGWQERYFILKNGTLSYFKSETDRSFGCRGAVSLARASLTCHPVDECRFDINVNENVWYLRAESAEDRNKWFHVLDLHKQAESGYGSMNSLRRQGSLLSITSATSVSNTSTSSFKRGRGLPEKLAEMETFRDILCKQVDTLQGYFDACTQALSVIQKTQSVHDLEHNDIDSPDDESNTARRSPKHTAHTNIFTPDGDSDETTGSSELMAIFQQHGAHAIDFKGEAITFKATTAGIISTLSHCIELMSQREDAWRKRYERELERRKKMEEMYKCYKESSKKPIVIGGPDYEEGPTCVINEDEFFDAVDASLDKLESEAETQLERNKILSKNIIKHAPMADTPGSVLTLPPAHKLYDEINSIMDEHIKYANFTVDSSIWEAIHDEGEMKVYRREMEEDGMIIDPLKAVHSVKGITGHELCHYFWDADVRMEWEGTLDSSTVIDLVSQDTVVSYQVYKRVWPTTQRDALFWSHIRHVPSKDNSKPDMWIVCNYSTDHESVPLQDGRIRIHLNTALVCETCMPEINSSRSQIVTNVSYYACVNPGGWAPPSVLRAVYKREYPKFLKRFTQYVTDSTANKPIMF